MSKTVYAYVQNYLKSAGTFLATNYINLEQLYMKAELVTRNADPTQPNLTGSSQFRGSTASNKECFKNTLQHN